MAYTHVGGEQCRIKNRPQSQIESNEGKKSDWWVGLTLFSIGKKPDYTVLV